MFKKFYKTLSILFIIFSMVLVFGCKEPEEELVDPETPTEETTSSDDSSDKKDKNDKTNKTDKTDGTTDDSSSSDGGNASQNPNNGGTTQATHYVPVIRITTTNPADPDDPLAFVTEPVSDTVKVHSTTGGNSWGTGYLSIRSPWYEDCKITVADESNQTVLEDVVATVKARGNYTTTYDKKGLKIKFDKKQSMLGLHGDEKYKEWVLLAAWKDFSMLRDYTAYNLARLMSSNYYASDAKLVEVYINDTYWGVYLLAEQQEAKRIGLTEGKADDGINATGYLIEYDTYGGVIENQSLPDPADNSSYYTVEQDFFKMDPYGTVKDISGGSISGFNQYYSFKTKYDDQKKAYAKTYMDNLWTICRDAVEYDIYQEFTSDYSSIQTDSTVDNVKDCVAKVIDLDSLVNTYILQEIACDLDLNWSSFYMDFDTATGKKLTFEAPWDFDSCFGNHKERQIGPGSINHLFATTNDDISHGNPWTVLFAKETWFQDMVKAKWAQMTSQNVKGQIISKINEISNDSVYVAAFKRNYDKWSNINTNIGDELASAAVACKTQREAADLLISFLNKRFTMLDSDFVNFTPSYKEYFTSGSTSIVGAYTQVVKDADGNVTSSVDRTYSGTLSVTATDDGLRITKSCEEYWEHTNIIVTKVGSLNNRPEIDNVDQNTNTILYKYVTAGGVYKVSLVQMDEKWQGWHQTQSVEVQAIGGSGDLYLDVGQLTFSYSSPTSTLTCGTIGTNLGNVAYNFIRLQATIFDGTPWADGVSNADGSAVFGSQTNIIEITDPNNFWVGKTTKGLELKYYFNIDGDSKTYMIVLLNSILP